MPLLRKGANVTVRFRAALVKAEIHAVYVEDPDTDGIDPLPPISAEARAEATRAVVAAFEGAKQALGTGRPLPPDVILGVEDAVARMAQEIGQNPDFALALADLSAADGYTLQHSIDVCALGLLIGQRMYKESGYVDYAGRRTWHKIDQRLTRLGVGLILHDIGKLAIPAAILNKPGELAPEEWELMKSHPRAGVELLRSHLISPLVKAVVREHHERWDGGGYPDGKRGAEIHDMARIAAVADVFDAVTSERVYARARPAHFGVRLIREGSGTAFDPEVAGVFSKLVAPFPPGDEIELADGRRGVVARVPEQDLDRPVVRVLGAGEPYEVDLLAQPELAIAGWGAEPLAA
jgi:HD-GYP domain-containing protein (c-di-GMP phosphodiesterase class II)